MLGRDRRGAEPDQVQHAFQVGRGGDHHPHHHTAEQGDGVAGHAGDELLVAAGGHAAVGQDGGVTHRSNRLTQQLAEVPLFDEGAPVGAVGLVASRFEIADRGIHDYSSYFVGVMVNREATL